MPPGGRCAGRNQYPPMAGVPELRAAIADKVASAVRRRLRRRQRNHRHRRCDAGALHRHRRLRAHGDEVIVFEPVYDSYVPAIETVGGKAVYAALRFPDYRPDWEQVRSLLSPRTRMIIINSPHNPTGSLLGADDLARWPN
jgi:methionine aminotransferase